MAKLRSTIATVLNIRPGEGLPLTLLLIHSFAQGLSFVFLETPANTLFLSKFSVESLPYVYIATAIVSTLIGFGYSKMEASIPPAKLLSVTLIFLLVMTGLFYGAFLLYDSKWLTMGLMIWKDVWWALTGIEFWALAGFLFNVRQGKRLFGLIGTGEVLAGILGGLSVPFILNYISTVQLLLIAAVGMLASLAVLTYTLRFAADRFAPAEGQDATEKYSKPFFQLFKERYLSLFFSVSILSFMCYYFIDYVFYDQVERAFPDEKKLASFFGVFYALLGSLDFISSAFVSGRLLTRYGLSFGLLMLPAADAVATGSAILSAWVIGPSALFLWLVVVSKLFDEVFRSSVQSHAFRILYQPLPAGQRLRIQTIRESIIEACAVGVAGVLLLFLTSVAALSALQLLYIVLTLLGACAALSLFLRREYTTVLMNALTKKRLRGLFFTLDDCSSLKVVMRGLHSPNPSEVIYCLRLLEENEHKSLAAHLLELLGHPEPVVRQYALERIEHLRLASAREPVLRLIETETAAPVLGQALCTFCAVGETEVFTHVPRFIGHPDPQVRKGALVGLLRSSGIDGVLIAGTHLNQLLDSPEPDQRKVAAQILGDVGIFNFYQPLLKLIRDPAWEVRKSALVAAGQVKNLNLVPLLVENLSDLSVREAAASALVRFGEGIIPKLEELFVEASAKHETRIRITQICGRIGGAEAANMLSRHLDFPNESVRNHILVALARCKYRAAEAERPRIEEQIKREAEDAAWALAAFEDLGVDEAASHLARALTHEANKNRERILLLLSFIYDGESVLQAKANLEGESVEKGASSLEVLDNLVAQEIKQMVFPLLDDLTPAERLARLSAIFPQQGLGRTERLREIILRPEAQATAWAKACALFAVGKARAADCRECAVMALSDPSQVVRETAAWTLAEIDGGTSTSSTLFSRIR